MHQIVIMDLIMSSQAYRNALGILQACSVMTGDLE